MDYYKVFCLKAGSGSSMDSKRSPPSISIFDLFLYGCELEIFPGEGIVKIENILEKCSPQSGNIFRKGENLLK